MKSKPHHTKLPDWIKSKGADVIAKKMKTKVPSVYQWGRRHCLPKAHQMQTIKKLSRGAVTYTDMIEGYLEKHGAL